MLATTKSHLADSLFRQVLPARQQQAPVLEIERAALNARRRWPDLAGMVDAAVVLVEGDSLYELVGDPAGLALCRPEAIGLGSVVSQTATGLGCTCDAWPPAQNTGPGDGLYCPDILAMLLQVYLKWPFPPLPYSPETLWQETLNELQYQMPRATFSSWLTGTRAVPEASTSRLLTIEVRNRYAQEWLAHRLQHVITRAVAGIAGYCLEVCFVVTTMRSDLLQTKEMLS